MMDKAYASLWQLCSECAAIPKLYICIVNTPWHLEIVDLTSFKSVTLTCVISRIKALEAQWQRLPLLVAM